MSSAHSASPVITTDVVSSENRIVDGPAIPQSVQPVASLTLAFESLLGSMYDPVVQYVRDPSNMSGVRTETVQQGIDKAKAAPAWYWTPDQVAILTRYIKDPDTFRQMLADANAARDVAKASYFTAIAENTAKAVASAIAAAGQPVPPVVAPTTLPATVVVSSETATVSATTMGVKSQSQRTKMAVKPSRAPARGKKTMSDRPQLVLSPKTPLAQKSAGGGPVAAASKKSAEEGKSPFTPTPTPDPHHRSSRANFDQWIWVLR